MICGADCERKLNFSKNVVVKYNLEKNISGLLINGRYYEIRTSTKQI